MSNPLFTEAPAEDLREHPPIRRDGTIAWELGATVIGFLAFFLAICLIVPEGERYVGSLGKNVATGLQFLFGQYVSFAVPAALLLLAIQVFLGKRGHWTPTRLVGVCLLLPALCGMLALPYADDTAYRTETFARAGALGSFLVEWDGLGLVGGLGTVGAGCLLSMLALTGTVLVTGLPVSGLALLIARPFGRRAEAEEPAEEETRKPAPASPAKPGPRVLNFDEKPAAKLSKKSVPATPDEIDEEEAGGRGGLFGLFRERKATLLQPEPDEMEEPELPDTKDEDAIQAVAALEASQLDEEYERALMDEERQAEEDLEKGLPSRVPEPSPAAAPLRNKSIIIHDEDEAPAPVITGNPNNRKPAAPIGPAPAPAFSLDMFGLPEAPAEKKTPVTTPPPAPAAPEADLGDGLAKLFPTRWEKDGEEVTRREKPAKKGPSDEQVRDNAEARAFRRAGATPPPRDPALDEMFLGDPKHDELEGEDDPLFDHSLETRPKGVKGAKDDAAISAIEKDRSAVPSNRLAGYNLPEIELLEDPPKVDHRMSREEVLETSKTLEKTFADFNIEVVVTEVTQGPVVTRFELKPAPGIKVSRIVGLEHDIAMAMRAVSVRIVAPIPGKAAVGIEIPNKNRAGVYFRELASCKEFWEHPSPLAFALGKTIDGAPYFADLKKMPHLLIAGATGAGKSVCLNTIICSLLYRQRPDRLRMLMVDPKRVELSIYQDIPHLISPVVCDAKRAAAALAWGVEQMEERYKKLVDFNVRNIDGYNEIATNPEKQAKLRGRTIEPMPHLVIIVDELADLMVVAKNEVEESIQRLAQMARAVGIHLILATQRPSVNVITGIIKANFPTRIAFQVSQKVDSRTILDANGAETLLGRGDMLFAPAGAQKPIRVQGAFLSDAEVESIAAFCRDQVGPMYEVEEFEPLLSEKEQRELAKLMGNPENFDDLEAQDRAVRGTNKSMGKVSAGMFVPHDGGSANAGDDEIDEALVRAAAKVILEGRKGSTSLVQRRLKVGFARAGRLMDMLEEMGIVGPYKGSKPRDILVDCDAALEQLEKLEGQIAQSGSSRRAAMDLDGVDVDDEDEDLGDGEDENDEELREVT